MVTANCRFLRMKLQKSKDSKEPDTPLSNTDASVIQGLFLR